MILGFASLIVFVAVFLLITSETDFSNLRIKIGAHEVWERSNVALSVILSSSICLLISYSFEH